jgi:hypothetical protein
VYKKNPENCLQAYAHCVRTNMPGLTFRRWLCMYVYTRPLLQSIGQWPCQNVRSGVVRIAARISLLIFHQVASIASISLTGVVATRYEIASKAHYEHG